MEKAVPQGVEKTSPHLSLGHAQLFAVLFLASQHHVSVKWRG